MVVLETPKLPSFQLSVRGELAASARIHRLPGFDASGRLRSKEIWAAIERREDVGVLLPLRYPLATERLHEQHDPARAVFFDRG